MTLGARYQLGTRLGEGGMAEVFLATALGAEGFTRRVALKRVLPEYSRNEMFGRMFINEARIASALHHPNIVGVLDFDRDEDGRLFQVMELVEGCDLDHLLGTGLLPLPVVIHVTVETLRGLGHAHDLVVSGKRVGLVHRDVSPHNVLLSWDGAVKVSDFGIAKAVAASNAGHSRMLKGKVAYMSPEQAQVVDDLDGRSDLWAVGVMLHEMLTGRPLFSGGATPAEVLGRMLAQQLQPPSVVRPGIPPDLDAVTMTLLQRDRDQRFPHARDAIDALLGCRDAGPRGADLLADLLVERFPGKAPPRVRLTAPSLPTRLASVGPGEPAWGSGVAPTPPGGGFPVGTAAMPPERATVAPVGRPTVALPEPRRRGWVAALVVAGLVASVGAGLLVWRQVRAGSTDAPAASEPASAGPVPQAALPASDSRAAVSPDAAVPSAPGAAPTSTHGAGGPASSPPDDGAGLAGAALPQDAGPTPSAAKPARSTRGRGRRPPGRTGGDGRGGIQELDLGGQP